MMDNVIDLNHYPIPQAEITNKKYRAVGLGTSGYHQWLALNGHRMGIRSASGQSR